MTMGSSWLGSVPWKSESEKVMGGILLCVRLDIACTCWTTLRCLFLEEEDLPPPANPLDIVLIVPHRGGLSWLRLCWFPLFCVLCSGWLSPRFSAFDSLIISSLSLPVIVPVILGSGWALPCFSYVVCKMSGPDEFFYFVA